MRAFWGSPTWQEDRRRHRRPSAVVALAIGAAGAIAATFGAPSGAGATPVAVPEVQLVVRLAPSTALHAASSVLGGLPGSRPAATVQDRWTMTVPVGEEAATLARLRSNPGVEYATATRRVHAAVVPAATATTPGGAAPVRATQVAAAMSNTPNDVCYSPGCPALTGGAVAGQTYSEQQYLSQVGAPGAWSVTHGSSSILVAVLDTGVRSTHQDLGKVVAGPNVCAADDPACAGITGPDTDDAGHGTHVSGIVAATTDNALGVASLGWDTRAETFKVLDSQGGGSTADLATGIYDAVAAGARIVNMSLGNAPCSVDPNNCGPDPDTQAAVEYAQAHNVVVVAAAGNGDESTGRPDPTYPAGYAGVLSVAAVDGSGNTSTYSEYGAAANISAPGNAIVSTWFTSDAAYSSLTGTSMSTPVVSAAAALVLAVNPSLSAADVTSILRRTAGPEGGRAINGGIVNAAAAVDAANASPSYGGYHLAGADGSVYAFGSSPYFGGLTGTRLNRPVVAGASRPDHTGYWLAAADGGIFSFGSAAFHGSTGGLRLNAPIVGMASTPDGNGYWLVASDGGIFTFGSAAFFGSTGALRLNAPIVGMASTPDGNGYWLVASDGGIFAFGTARFRGSAGNLRLNKPVVGMAALPGGNGYWMVASDGGIFSYGSAAFHGSTGNLRLNRPVVAMRATSTGSGYWMAASDGGIFSFGDAPYEGSAGGAPIPAPVVTIS